MSQGWYRSIGAALLACLAVFASSWSPTLRIALAIAVGVPSFALMMVGRHQLGSSFAVMPAAKSLVTSGLYARVQHPMYLFLDLWVLAAIVAVGWRPALIVWVVLVVAQMLQSRREESILAHAFGAEYEAYRRHTWL
jgi:protein-S-isoprenylcysteine O-methyltransferase Ste14